MKKRQGLFFFLFLLFCIILLFIADTLGPLDAIRGSIEKVIISVRTKEETLQNQEQTTLAQIASLSSTITILNDENNALRKQLEAPLPASMQFILGKVLGFKSNGDKRYANISIGKENGVENGMPLVLEQVLLGTVIESTPYMSIVSLLSSSDSTIAVKTENGARGILRGISTSADNEFLLLDSIPKQQIVSEGDQVVTSGEDGLPPDLVVGTVESIVSDERDPVIKATVKGAVDTSQINTIFVIKST